MWERRKPDTSSGDNDEISLVNNHGDSQQPQLPLSRSRSFVSPNALPGRHEAELKWQCVSPFTQHVIRETPSPQKIRRRRSRSFNDYIESRHAATPIDTSLLLPPLKEFQQPSPLHPTSAIPASPMQNSLDEEDEQPEETEGNPFYMSILFGVINATIVLPVVMSFGNIIYQDAAFIPYMPVLIKLTLVSGVVHQLCFSTFSTLKFAVGSVQDAGLIFLSSMARDMVSHCRSKGHSDEIMLATVTVGLACGAAILGVGLVLVGKLRLAGCVQMLPTSVVAGYLAYIGWFCGKSGVGIMAGSSHLTVPMLWENIWYVLPGIVGGIFIYACVRTFRHVAVLPTCTLILLVLFYAGLAIKGSSIEEATANGWIREAEPAPVWYRTWDYLKISKVDWTALPQLFLTELSMIFVVALSSSLDVAAIELELKRKLNYNKELTVVGISNVISGLTGGYTGSYIFSQSIFSLRSGIRSRLAGYILAICQIGVIVAPFPVMSYVPNFFFGSLLGMICIDLMYEWLYDFYFRVTRAEYVIGLCTFFLIQFIGVEYGIIVGVVIYFLCYQLKIDFGEVKMVSVESEEDVSVTRQEPAALPDEHSHLLDPSTVVTNGNRNPYTSII